MPCTSSVHQIDLVLFYCREKIEPAWARNLSPTGVKHVVALLRNRVWEKPFWLGKKYFRAIASQRFFILQYFDVLNRSSFAGRWKISKPTIGSYHTIMWVLIFTHLPQKLLWITYINFPSPFKFLRPIYGEYRIVKNMPQHFWNHPVF